MYVEAGGAQHHERQWYVPVSGERGTGVFSCIPPSSLEQLGQCNMQDGTKMNSIYFDR